MRAAIVRHDRSGARREGRLARRRRTHLPMRSALAGVGSSVVDAGLFAVLAGVLMGPSLVLARWVCGAAGAGTNFALNRCLAFRATREPLGPQARRYALVAPLSITAATVIWWVLGQLTRADPRVLHPVSLALAWLLVTYPLLRGWVFREAAAARCATAGNALSRGETTAGRGD